jgi:hypothetical protein
MVDARFPVIEFHQYGSERETDRLYVFAAPAKVLAAWAGVPRKGWRIRMLYQRWITPQRERDLATFWERAATPNLGIGEDFILGPTAITLAIQEELRIEGNFIHLSYNSPIDFDADLTNNLQRLANTVLPRVTARLTERQRIIVRDFAESPLSEFPDVSHDYVLEFALQLLQMQADPQWFIDENAIEAPELREMLVALEALCRPALVVDGQHRLLGAAQANVDVMLPVVAMPHCSWGEQVYQFIVINEKAQKVDSSLLTDIFGSSLARHEQAEIRDRLARARVDVEARIAAVVANREPSSPFYGMVRVPLGGVSSGSRTAYVTDITIRLLVEGSARHSRGWRSDDEFYQWFVRPTVDDRVEWDSWTSGQWREYWFAFWHSVKDYYNEQARRSGAAPLWDPTRQTNLTKAVTLRLFQKLFMDKMIERMKRLEQLKSILEEELGLENAQTVVEKRRAENALPADTENFRSVVVDEFLVHIPVRIFLLPWVRSLDDDQGRADLYAELEKAYERGRTGQIYRAQNKSVFDIATQ